ncbi:helix-turn-helix domain-containing protein [Actinomadura hibisca]|uniref:helix-turn-helix domain-containing protein n=1 Tax=Actinomadura hibisca TaxID=68565 RepID=UPI00082C5896|nr:helix-turn-helix transcriptional regulator [Actinomadura hibisca]
MPQVPKRLEPSRGPRELFGSEARHHRERAGLSLRALAEKIPYAASTISEIERGDAGCDRVFAEVADEALDTGGALARLHDGLFDGRSAAFPKHFAQWPDFEDEAELLCSYQPMIMAGLLQTPDYAAALLNDPEAVQGRVERQRVLVRPNAPRLIAIMPEVVLWNQIGDAKTMHGQLLYLADGVPPNVSVQIIPNGEPHRAHLGAFVLARLPRGVRVAYADGEPRGKIMDGRADLDALHERFSDIATHTLPATMSATLIRRTADERWKI